MKNHRFSGMLILSALFLFFASLQNAQAQVQTARYVSMGPNVNAFYEYLPQGYDPNGSQTYPFILFIHGLGETGDGSSTNLPKVLRNGIPRLINNGTFPTSFNVNGQTHRFIVISPQFNAWPGLTDVDGVIEYVKSHYKVDTRRIYVTGLSMGGGATWDYGGCSSNLTYVQKVAAIVPICGASWPSPERAQTIATYNLPVWALHNQNDPTAPVSYTNDYINLINNRPAPPNPLAKKTIFPVSGHDAWTKAYDPNYRENNMNVYEWMLQYTRGGGGTTPPPSNAAPTVNAGPDATITLPTATATLSATASDPDGSIASYRWEIVSQPAGASALLSANTSATASVAAMTIAGLYRFRVTVTDNSGATATDSKDVTVNTAPSAGTKYVRVNLFSGSNGENGWNNWNVNSSLSSGTFTYSDGSNSGVTAVLSGQTGVADNTAGYATTMCPVNVGRYASYSTSSRTLTLSGLVDGRSYSLEVYSSRQGATNNSTKLTINGSAQTVSTDNNLANKLTFSGLSSSGGRLVVTIDKVTTYNYINGFTLTEAGAAPAPNTPPVTNAGSDKNITLPTNSIAMSATASDANGTISTYAWTKVSGPSAFTLSSAAVLNPTISSLVEGTYTFRLTVTDNAGATASDDVLVIVNPAPVTPPPPPPVASTRYVKVNLFGGSTPSTSPEWNNWNTNSSLNSSNFKYSDGTASTVNAALSLQTGVGDNGAGYNTTMCPVEVGRSASYAMATRTLTIAGLDNGKTYNLELYGSRNGATNNSTRYTVGTTAVTVKTDNNLSNKAAFSNFSPVDGKVTVTVEKLTTYNYINGFTLTEITSAPAARMATTAASEEAASAAGLELFPNPVQDRFTLRLNNTYKGQLTVLITDMSGVVQKRFYLNKATEGAYQSYLSVQDLKAGEYILTTQISGTVQSVKLSKL